MTQDVETWAKRTTITVVVALVLALQSLAAGAALARGPQCESVAAASLSAGERCAKASQPDEAPARSCDWQCCLACDFARPPAGAATARRAEFPPPAAVSQIAVSRGAFDERLPGWASSWSSRAPPRRG
jgi:hypothetical protein